MAIKEIFHSIAAENTTKEEVLRTRKDFNTLKIFRFMALKVKAGLITSCRHTHLLGISAVFSDTKFASLKYISYLCL